MNGTKPSKNSNEISMNSVKFFEVTWTEVMDRLDYQQTVHSILFAGSHSILIIVEMN